MTRFRANTGYSCNVACQKPKDILNCKGEDDAEELKCRHLTKSKDLYRTNGMKKWC